MIYPRPNFTIDPTTLPPSVQLADTPLLEVSSTFIRQALAEGRDIRYFLHPAVYERLKKKSPGGYNPNSRGKTHQLFNLKFKGRTPLTLCQQYLTIYQSVQLPACRILFI